MRVHRVRRHYRRLAAAVFAVAVPLSLAGPSDVLAARSAQLGGASHSSPEAGVCKSTITLCALRVLAPAGGIEGVYLKQVGGSVLASKDSAVAFEPASTIKAVIGLYALTEVQSGKLEMTTPVPAITLAGGTEDCPPGTIVGTEPLGTAVQQMLQVSDNNRTRELMQYFGVSTLNAFIASLGMKSSHFQTSAQSPGFNVIGCNSYPGSGLPTTLDGNTLSLADLGILWTKIAALPTPYASAFYTLAAGREMANSVGYDFSGIWPGEVKLIRSVAPTSLTTSQVNSFIDHAQLSVKGGSYDWYTCTTGTTKCERAWASFAFVASFPTCQRASLRQTELVGGDFVQGSDTAYAKTPVAFNVVGSGIEALLRTPVLDAVSNWKACAPKQLPVLKVVGSTMRSSRTVGLGATLATFTDSALGDVSPDVLATISWGDGTTSTATVSGGKGEFQVRGWHQFASGGVHKLTITVKSEATNVASSATTTLEVA